jgi:hypothetical protein
MRRLWTFIIAGAFLAVAADGADAQMRIGAKGGVSFANMSLDPDEDIDTESLLGFVGGGEVQIPIGTGGVSVQPELLYIRKGFEETEAGETFKLQVDYIEIPLLLRYDIPAAAVRPYVLAGGTVSFEASCKLVAEDETVSADIDCDDEAAGVDTESTDFGVLFGGGIAFPAGPGALFIEGRYGIGLADVDAEEGSEAKHRVGAVMVGYSVSLDPTRR